MAVKVLIVDDSGFFRKRIEEMLKSEPRIKVVGTASNGNQAIEQAVHLRPDVITMDVEMPGMSGIEAVAQIMQKAPTQVLMLSSLTHEGARVTLQALDAGAADYLPKEASAWISNKSELQQDLIRRILALGQQTTPYARSAPSSFGSAFRSGAGASLSTLTPSRSAASAGASRTLSSGEQEKPPVPMQVDRTHASLTSNVSRLNAREGSKTEAVETRRGVKSTTGSVTTSVDRIQVPDAKLVVIGASTGGPGALQILLSQLPANFPAPIMLIQHMPNTFTSVFAERLNKQCQIEVRQAVNGDQLRPGLALLAPGGMQMIIDPRQKDRVSVLAGDASLTYKPSVDVTYASVAKFYGKQALALILTGMGADGADGARLLKREGACIWAQSKDSCTIYGMPAAIISAGLADEVLDINDLGRALAKRGRR